jgi:hypothetical protein
VKFKVKLSKLVFVGVYVQLAVLEPFSTTLLHPEIADPPTLNVICPATLEVALNVIALPYVIDGTVYAVILDSAGAIEIVNEDVTAL